MEAPPHLLERPPGMQIALAVGGPIVLGAICGILVGVNEAAYTVLSLLAILGGVAAGYEHPTADEGSIRGFCGGIVFGTMIVAIHAVSGMEAEAKLPHPPGFLVVVTTIFGILFGALGGWLRARHDRRERLSTRTAS